MRGRKIRRKTREESENPLEQEFVRFGDSMVPENLDGGDLKDSRQRALILVGVLGISGVSAAMLTALLFTLYAFTSNVLHFAAAVIATLTLVGYAGTFYYFRRYSRLLPAAHAYAFTTLVSTIAPCVITGGVTESPYLPMVLIVPIFLFLMAGPVRGVQWSLGAAVIVTGLLFAEQNGVYFPQAIAPAYIPAFTLGTWATTLCLLVIGLYSYESSFQSFTQRISAERSQFAHEATHDDLTGLSNRKLFYLRANEAVDYARTHDHKAAILYIDLDDFKLINDANGHKAGDEVLSIVAQRLQISVRSIDTVSRLGGDEFAVVLHGIEEVGDAYLAAEKLRRVLQEPFALGGQTIAVPGSIGVAVAPDDGEDVDELLRKADTGMYQDKESRQNIRLVSS